MDVNRWEEVERLLNDALLLKPEQRAVFVAGIADPAIRVEVESLLRAPDVPIEAAIADAAAAFSISSKAFSQTDGDRALTTIPAGHRVGAYEVLRPLRHG
jgi:hypothetical protein